MLSSEPNQSDLGYLDESVFFLLREFILKPLDYKLGGHPTPKQKRNN